MRKWLIGFSFLLLVLACDIPSDQALTEQKVTAFRDRIKSRDYDGVFSHASAAFRKTANKPLFINAVDPFSSEIGQSENFTLNQSKFLYSADGQYLVVLDYNSQSEKVASEEYVFVKENGDFVLYNYEFTERGRVEK